jgi:hypothetical protein
MTHTRIAGSTDFLSNKIERREVLIAARVMMPRVMQQQ